MGETMKIRMSDAEAPGYRTGLVAVLDIGSSKTVCLIGKADPGNLRVLGAALRESQGVKAGTITSYPFSTNRRATCDSIETPSTRPTSCSGVSSASGITMVIDIPLPDPRFLGRRARPSPVTSPKDWWRVAGT